MYLLTLHIIGDISLKYLLIHSFVLYTLYARAYSYIHSINEYNPMYIHYACIFILYMCVCVCTCAESVSVCV